MRRFPWIVRWIGIAGSTLAPAAMAGVEVTLLGVDGAELANIEARLSIRDYAAKSGRDEAQIRRLHRQAGAEIRSALQVFGYYSPVIRTGLRQEGADWRARYEIEPGPPVLIERLTLALEGEGRALPALTEALADTELQEGARLRHEHYETTKTAMARAAYQSGFLDAAFAMHRMAVDVERQRAQLTLVLDTGPRYYFGALHIEEKPCAPDAECERAGLDPAFLRRYVPIVEGQPFDPQRLLDAQFALSDLGYFGSVEVRLLRDVAVAQRVPVVIEITPRPRQRYDIGLGYGTDTGARATLSAEFRRLNDAGHKVRTDLRVSEVKNTIGADYRVPLGTQAGEHLGFAAGYVDEEFGDPAGNSRRFDLSTSLLRIPGDWQRRLYLHYLYEESFFAATGRTLSKLLFPGLSLSRGETDDAIHARLGWYLFLDVHGTHHAVVSDTSFLQGRAIVRGVLPLGTRARLLGRAELAASAVDDFAELPASQRFFAGGDQSVRGYSYQSLGPVDATGAVVGGRFLSTYSLETEYRVWNNWGAAVFFDVGGAANDTSPELFKGVGAGLRYRAPIGTLQFDLAHPLDGDQRGIRPHIGIRVGL